MNQMADFWWEFIKISIIALAFTANEPNQWGNNSNFCVWPYIRHNIMYEVWFLWWKWRNFENAIAFTANEPKLRGK